MKAMISMSSLWQMIQPLPLDNRKWLSDRLQESIKIEEEAEYITKKEILAGIEAGLKDLKAGRKQSLEEFIKEMEECAVE